MDNSDLTGTYSGLVFTRSSAVAVIADRTALPSTYYSGKLSNRFRLQVDERLVPWYARSDSTGRV